MRLAVIGALTVLGAAFVPPAGGQRMSVAEYQKKSAKDAKKQEKLRKKAAKQQAKAQKKTNKAQAKQLKKDRKANEKANRKLHAAAWAIDGSQTFQTIPNIEQFGVPSVGSERWRLVRTSAIRGVIRQIGESNLPVTRFWLISFPST